MSDAEFISIVIPALNEEAYIEAAIESLVPEAGDVSYEILVMDGGSADRTREIVREVSARNPRVRLVDNPKRVQSAAMNLAASVADGRSAILVRADAHCGYPKGFARKVAAALRERAAESIVVPMKTVGIENCFQRAVSAAQNSRLGNGGSPHRRMSPDSGWIDHGHHAGFDRSFFKLIGGYDESFAANEDAEYDVRVRKAGGRIWMESSAAIEYHPRSTPQSLWKQYFGYGRGRAMTTFKHKVRLKARQMLPPAAVGASVAGILFSPLCQAGLLLPLGYLAACVGFGLLEARRIEGGRCEAAMGFAVVIMHVAWAAGFSRKVLGIKLLSDGRRRA